MKGIAGRFIKGMLSVAVSCALLLGGCAPAQSQGDAAAQETRPAAGGRPGYFYDWVGQNVHRNAGIHD